MGLGCVLFFWAILGAIGLATAAAGALVLSLSTARQWKPGMIAGRLLRAGGTVVVVGALAFIGGWLFWGIWPHETTSRSAFEDAFGSPAGAEVTQIRSRTSSSTDWHRQFLRFHAPPRTIATITHARFKRVPAQRCRQQLHQWKDDAPAWWPASPPPRTECYNAERFDHRLVSNSAWLLYDPASGEAYFHYLGVE